MKRTSLSVATALAGAIALLGAYTTPATAAGGPPSSNCPVKNGPGNVLIEDVTIDMMAGDMVLGTPVIKDGVEAEIVCVRSTKDMGYASYYIDHEADTDVLDYQSYGAIGVDKVVVGTVDKNGIYNSTEVTYNITAVQLVAPTVAQKAIKKHGKVVKPAIVSFVNNSDHTIQVMAGNMMEMEPDVIKNAAPGQTIKIKTKREKLDFLQLVVIGTGKMSYTVANAAGQANTLTGKVLMDNLWYTPEELGTGMVGRKAISQHDAPLHWLS